MNPTINHPAQAPVAIQEHPASVPVGDWLLAFGVESPPGPARLGGGLWEVERQGAGWRMWRTIPGDGWRGAPLTRVAITGWSAWLFGELYGTDDAAATVRAVLCGETSAAGLNGHFLLLACDEAADEWHVWTNRHATLHAYLATDGARVALGSFMPAIAAAAGRDELDWEGLTTFFAYGFFGGERTHLRGVSILRPATHYHFDDGGRLLSEERYWRWHHAPDHARSYDDTVDTFATLFGEVMRDLTATGRVAIPISGGLDSRSTVVPFGDGPGQTAPSAERFWAYSYGYSDNSIETRIAAEVAAARGLTFTPFTIRPYLFDKLPQIMAAVEGFEDLTLCRQASIVDTLDDRADFLIAAHGGDLYLDAMGVGPAYASTEALSGLALKKFVKGGSQWLLDNLCQPAMGAVELQPLLAGVVSAELERLEPVDDPDFRLKMLKTDQWVSRWTAVALRMFQSAAFPRLPFYDTRLLDFFCTVPTSYLVGRRLQIDYLRRYAPDLARVQWQASGHNLFHSGKASMWDLARRATRKGVRYLSRQRIRELNWEVQFMGHAGQDGLTRWLLRPGLALHELVPPTAIRTLLDDFRRDPYTEKRGYTVAMLLTFSAWLELQRGGRAA